MSFFFIATSPLADWAVLTPLHFTLPSAMFFSRPPKRSLNARALSLVPGYRSYCGLLRGIAWLRGIGKFVFCIKMCKVSPFFGAYTLTGGFLSVPLYIFVHFDLRIDLAFARSIGIMIGKVFDTWQRWHLAEQWKSITNIETSSFAFISFQKKCSVGKF